MPVTINASTSSGLVQSADTSGQIELQSNGTTKATVSSSGLAIGQYNPSTSLITSGTAVNSTSGTSIDFTSIPSWVKRITVMFDSVSTNGSAVILIQIGTSGGIQTTGYNNAGLGTTGGNLGTTQYTDGFGIGDNNGASDAFSGWASICLIGSNVWATSGGFHNGSNQYAATGGSKSLGATLDRVRVTTANGTDTFDAGTINILYE